jgi:hypothetical protein
VKYVIIASNRSSSTRAQLFSRLRGLETAISQVEPLRTGSDVRSTRIQLPAERLIRYPARIPLLLPQGFHRINHAGAAGRNIARQERN